jgi:hypothetical protein
LAGEAAADCAPAGRKKQMRRARASIGTAMECFIIETSQTGTFRR